MASSIVESVAETVGKLSVNEVTSLYYVNNKIELLRKELVWINCFLKDAERPRNQVAQQHVSDTREFAHEIEDIIDVYDHQISHPREDGVWNTLKWFCHLLDICEAWKLHNLGSKIDKLTLEMVARRRWLQTYGSQNTAQSTTSLPVDNDLRQTYPHTEEVVVGLKKDVDQVVDNLIKTDAKVVGISGMGGLGKTTLARKVFSDKRIQQHFNKNNCAWVYVSRKVDKIRVFKAILFGLNKNVEVRNEINALRDEELPVTISETLGQRECLVILEDIWTAEAWELLKPAFVSIGTSKSQSKILLTTRHLSILQGVQFCPTYSHPLATLNEEDGLKLLLFKAFPQKISSAVASSSSLQNQTHQEEPQGPQVDDETEKVGREMIRRCKGLPLAIIVLGGILYKKRTPWKTVLSDISSYLTEEGDAAEWLELSYYDLPFYLKPCFLYLGNFPEDYGIKVERLYQLWGAEGLLIRTEDGRLKGETYLEIGERYLNELIQRSVVQVRECWSNGRIKSCEVHDIMRDICLKKCKEECFLGIQQCTNLDLASILVTDPTQTKRKRRCAFYAREGFVDSQSAEYKEKSQYLRSLLVFLPKGSREEFPKEMISNIQKLFPLLRVLDLQDTFIKKDIPGEVGQLIHLKYLSFRHASVEKLPSRFWDLKYLITLDLRSTRRMTLPNKFHEMKLLRHLFLPKDFDVENGERLTFNVDNMETLKNFHPGNCELEDLLKMKYLRIFAVQPGYYFGSRVVLETVGKSPVIASGYLMNPLHMGVEACLINEDPATLTSLFKGDSCFTKLTLNGGHRNNMIKQIASGVQVFPHSLTHVQIQACGLLNGKVILALGKLPHLELLHLIYASFKNKLCFSSKSFKQLKTLIFNGIGAKWEWELGDGALPNLQRLVLFTSKLVCLPNNLPDSLYIECPVIRVDYDVEMKYKIHTGGVLPPTMLK